MLIYLYFFDQGKLDLERREENNQPLFTCVLEELIDQARNSIGQFCITVCKAQCCKRGKLVFHSQRQANVVFGAQKNLLNERVSVEPKSGYVTLDMSSGGCPALINNMCTVYDKKERPRACHEFPLFVVGKTIMPVNWCPAVQQRLFDEYFALLKEQGFRILED